MGICRRPSFFASAISFLCIIQFSYLTRGQELYSCAPGSKNWPCFKDANGQAETLRVIFIDQSYVTTNRKLTSNLGINYAFGNTCDDQISAPPECFVFDNWNGGWIGAFMNQVLSNMGLNIVAMTPANFSDITKNISDSRYTRCVWEVKLGNADLCVGDFWSTSALRNLSVLTSSIDSDEFTLYTTINPSVLPPAFDPYQLLSVLWPFERSVWLMAIVTILILTFAIRVVEPRIHDEETNHASDLSMFSSVEHGVEEIISDVYDMVMAFFGGSGTLLNSARSWPARIIAVGVGIFVFIHFNSYTGSLAAYYVSTGVSQLGAIGSLDDIAAQNGRLCVTQALLDAAAPTLASVVPRASFLVADKEGPMLEMLYQGKCSGAVLSKFDALQYVAASTANFTACTDPRDPRNWSACADPAMPPAQFRLSPATCGGACGYARRYCGLVAVADATVASLVLMWQLPVSARAQPWVSWGIQAVCSVGNLSLHQAIKIIILLFIKLH